MKSEIRVSACAKINIGLQVFPRRNDGFHEIQSIFQTVSFPYGFRDVLTVEYDTDADFFFKVQCDSLKLPEDNTLFLAYKAFCSVTGLNLKGISVNLEKKIPSGAGLGGGSSDGASLVKALEKLTEIHLSDFQLDNIASKIGSDVFFFIHCDFNQSESEKNLIEGTGCALVSGRGENVKLIQKRNDLFFLLVLPEVFSSTKEAYNLLDNLLDLKENMCYINFTDFETMYNGFVSEWQFVNTFTPALSGKYLEIENCLNCIKKTGALYVEMSGSGSTCYGVFSSLKDAENARVQIAQQGFRCAVVK